MSSSSSSSSTYMSTPIDLPSTAPAAAVGDEGDESTSNKNKVSSTTKKKQGNLSRNQQKKIEKATLALQQQNLAFDRYYSAYYGEDRWHQRLKPALIQKGKHVALVNRRADVTKCRQVLDIVHSDDDKNTTAMNPLVSIPYLPSFFPNVYIRSSTLNGNSSEKLLEHVEDPSNLESNESSNEPLTTTTEIPLNEQDPISDQDLLDSNELHPTSKSVHIPWPSPTLLTSLDPDGLCVYYPLDYASLFPVVLLDIHPHHHVLDLCAAPGGKSLAISQLLKLSTEEDDDLLQTSSTLNPELGYLECNDASSDRRIRLFKVLKNYLPPSCFTRTHVSLGDATKYTFVKRFGSERKFDRILVDAPCSSERHLLQELGIAQDRAGKHKVHVIPEYAKEYMSWTVNRSKTNAERQFLLLWNALQLCQPGGRVVYSTCALSPLENDGVIEKILQKLQRRNIKVKDNYRSKEKDGEDENETLSFDVDIVPMDENTMPFGEKTRYGWQILPDNNACGWGPIFCTILHKIV